MNSRIAVFFKLICLAYLIFLIPRVISLSGDRDINEGKKRKRDMWLGSEYLVKSQDEFGLFKNMKMGFVCGKHSVDQRGRNSVDQLTKHGYSLNKILVLLGDNGDKSFLRDFGKKHRKKFRGTTVYSFNRESLRKLWADDIDAVMVDVQDSGVGNDTTLQVLLDIMRGAWRNHKKVIVLDRPNPLGEKIEGPGKVIPWRHGITIGEMAYYLNKYILEQPMDLSVVPMVGWRRSRILPDLKSFHDRVFVDVMKEVRPMSVSVDVDTGENTLLFSEMNRLSDWEQQYFRRLFWKLGLHCKDHFCRGGSKGFDLKGVRFSVKKDIGKFSSFNAIVSILRFINYRKNVRMALSHQFDEQFGSGLVRKFVRGSIGPKSFKLKLDKSLSKFYSNVKGCLLYKPYPVIETPTLVKI
jgi:hypothetical protein